MSSSIELHDASSRALAKCLGHPRTALVVGRDLASAVAILEGRGAEVLVVDTGTSLPPVHVDLVVASEATVLEGSAGVDAVAHGLKEALGEEAHVVIVAPPHGGTAQIEADRIARVERALRDAGLEVMRAEPSAALRLDVRLVRSVHSLYTGEPSPVTEHHGIVIARRAPVPKKMTFTIGMLSMNEEESVEKMIEDIRAVAPDAKILLVDSSRDRTPEIAERLGARVVRQLPPRGHGPAMERLMYEASKESDALIYLDCDFTYPSSYIPRIRELLEAGADVVNATRTHHYPKAMPVPNFLANRFFAASAQLVHGVPTTDVHSGMRGYRSSMIRAFDFSGEGDALPLDTLILPARFNYDIAEMPIPYQERVGDSKLAKLRGTAWTFIRIAGMIGEGKRVSRSSHYRHVDGERS
jgi:hypothetical protein